MSELVFPDPPPDDPGEVTLGVLLAGGRRAWLAAVTRNGRPAFAFLTSAAGSAGWWVSVVEMPLGSRDPVPAGEVAYALRCIGVEPDGVDWSPDPRFGEESANPFLVNDPRTWSAG